MSAEVYATILPLAKGETLYVRDSSVGFGGLTEHSSPMWRAAEDGLPPELLEQLALANSMRHSSASLGLPWPVVSIPDSSYRSIFSAAPEVARRFSRWTP